ncbi:MAG: alpha/beta hydrolase [Rubrivivax sp.]|nr:alpha/beta hydrolase [Rubrivivax sp.]
MRIRFALVVVALASFGAAAFAECGAVSPEALDTLEAKLAQTQSAMAATPEADRDKPGYRVLQERALLELEQVQCKREATAPTEAVKRGPGVATTFATIPVLFVTDRAPVEPPPDAAGFFGAQRRTTGVAYGRVMVRMPAENYVAGAAAPKGITLSTEEGSSAGISVAMPQLMDADAFSAEIAKYKSGLPTSAPVRVLLFVHGFNVSYKDSVQAAARLAWGVRFDALPIAISWPSQAKVLRYWQDEQSIEPSTERLRPIVQKVLSHPQIDEVIVVAHSMGTRLTTRLLSQLDLAKASIPKLTRVAFAAADLNEEEINELWPRIQSLPKKGWTFYTSGNDYALLASDIVHARPPVGDSRDRVFTAKPGDTVDASAIAPALKGYGHSYVVDNPQLHVDLRRWVFDGLAVADRGLKAGDRPPAEFWVLPKKP